MELPICILVDPSVVRCREIVVVEDGKSLELRMETIQTTAICPKCAQPSARVHSAYSRTLADLPWASTAVTLQVDVRRFFCDTPDCPQRIFTERFPSVAAPWARRTQRLADLQQQMGLLTGASTGAALCAQWACPIGVDALILLVRDYALIERPVPRVLGVDDWAKRKGQSYGTILVDHERGWVVDILEDRTPETLAAWLRDHPGVEIVTRDRAEAYAQGIREGAPQAVQVADRFHLLKNLTDAMGKMFQDHLPVIQRQLTETLHHGPPLGPVEAAVKNAEISAETDENARTQAGDSLPREASEDSEADLAPERTVADERRQQRAAEAHQLHEQGWTAKAIAEHLNCCPKTISRYLRRQLPLAPCQRERRTKLELFADYLLTRWNEGCRNAAQLFRELCQRGYDGRLTIVRDYVAILRRKSGIPARSRQPGGEPLPVTATKRLPSYRRLAWLATQLVETLDEENQRYVELVKQGHPDLTTAVDLARRFTTMVCQRHPEDLDTWLDEVIGSNLPALRSLANGLRDDYEAVRAALTLEWSNGRTEGHVNRLKCIKRQMYGRAKLDLLRCRVMAI